MRHSSSLQFLVATAKLNSYIPDYFIAGEDLKHMTLMVQQGEEPWKSVFEVFRNDPQSQVTYKIRRSLENPTIG
jgi:hypothetical protein